MMREPEDFYTWDLWQSDLSIEIRNRLEKLDALRLAAERNGRLVEEYEGYWVIKNQLDRLGYGV